MTTLKIAPAFAVPFVHTAHPNPAPLNHALRELFLAREAEGERWANPSPYTQRNEALFESHFDLFQWPEPCIQALREFCFNATMQTLGELNGYEPAFLRRIRMGVDAWYHITRRGGLFGVHNHPMASWSGVYCVSGGRHDPGQADSGLLNFINPFSMNTMFIDAGTAQLREPYGHQHKNFRLEAGQLLLFPSWVLHQVLPYYGEGERITVAFNAWFKLAESA